MNRTRKRKQDEITTQERFFMLLKKYIGIKTIQIIITTRMGEEIILNQARALNGENLLIMNGNEVYKEIPLQDILKADLYAA